MNAMQLEQSLEILVDELVVNDELRHEFFRNPYATLREASEWGVPLTDREVEALCSGRYPIWERVADALNDRLALAA